jgi:hypothetical protein
MTTLRNTFERLWSASRPLTAFGIAMTLLAVISAALVPIDPTRIDDQLRWIKPTKFAISFAVYAWSVAWVLTYVGKSRLREWISWILTGTGALEIAVITGQTVRGKSSHFNNETALEAALFGIMGAGIVVFFVANMIAVLLAMRARIAGQAERAASGASGDGREGSARAAPVDRVVAAGLRLGFVIASVGMLEAVLMLPPTAEQAAELAAGRQPARLGAHTVGAPDGGKGLPIIGWSTEGGDLRPAHFVGMHALQAIPLFAVLVRRRRRWSEEQKVRLVWTVSAAHLAATVLLTVQALRGQPLLAPDALTLGAMVTILFASLLAVFVIDQQPVTERFAEVAR